LTGAALAALTVTLAYAPLDSPAQNGFRREPQFTTGGTESCLVCHSGDKMQAIRLGAHGEHAGKQTPMNDKGCESCHGPGSFHVSRAFGGPGFPPLIRFGTGQDDSPRQVQLEACLNCHRQVVDGREATPFVGSPHDQGRFNCSTCHVLHVAQDPLADWETQAALCYKCHGRMRTQHNQFEGKGIDLSSLACSACHDVHEVAAD